jgi:hypothetical protein
MNAFRNLYRLMDGRTVAAFITASTPTQALEQYRAAQGTVTAPTVERLTFGYPANECKVYK